MLGQNAPYIITSNRMLTAHARRLRRWSRTVLSKTLRNIVATTAVVGEEGFLELASKHSKSTTWCSPTRFRSWSRADCGALQVIVWSLMLRSVSYTHLTLPTILRV